MLGIDDLKVTIPVRRGASAPEVDRTILSALQGLYESDGYYATYGHGDRDERLPTKITITQRLPIK